MFINEIYLHTKQSLQTRLALPVKGALIVERVKFEIELTTSHG